MGVRPSIVSVASAAAVARRGRVLPLVVLLAAFAGGGLLAGCSSGSERPTARSSPSPSASSPGPSASASDVPSPGTGDGSPGASAGTPPLSSTDLPTLKPPTGPPKQPTDTFGVITIRGSLRISGSCRTLDAGGVLWTVVGEATAGLRDGDRVEVTGLPAPQVEAGCPGGVFQVRDARRL